jgi:hypothetical protein
MARVGLRGLARGTRTSPRGRLGGISSRPIVGVYSGKREVSRCVKPARVRAITAGAAGKGAGVEEEPSVPNGGWARRIYENVSGGSPPSL